MEKQNKRQLLIDAAYKVFARNGYKDASIKDIAHYANITPGLVHYYFKSKEELFFAVQEKVQREYHLKYEGADKDSTSFLDVLEEIKTRASENPDWYRLRYESYAHGMKEEAFQEDVAAFLKKGRESIEWPLKEVAPSKSGNGELAGILLACFDGLALQKIVDEDFNIDQAYEILWELISKYIKE
ncbi:TetR family transcriptional regulator [Gracilibacillus salitolerans]|uniref:TetR family transcriptional regulator n=1 Tax=Gracilibacillus salitolerans TaxID=2663022 RepID=A0A5Q2TQ04_9BACI|nr:TetR/AcrR family transcriptional regulator [Gracilibacillus salitolerans]QGH36815.1 TetR family transcriptional regulator [Gracilibacillus salitolerans]